MGVREVPEEARFAFVLDRIAGWRNIDNVLGRYCSPGLLPPHDSSRSSLICMLSATGIPKNAPKPSLDSDNMGFLLAITARLVIIASLTSLNENR